MLSSMTAFYQLDLNTANPSQLWEASKFCLRLGRLDRSLNLAYLATQKDSSQQQPYNNNYYLEVMKLGAELAEEIGNHHQAIHYWQQLVEYQLNNSEAWYGLAIALANVGKDNEAKQAFNRVLQLNPQHQKARLLLTKVQQ